MRTTDFSVLAINVDLKSSLHGPRNEDKEFNVEIREHLFDKAILMVGVLFKPRPIIEGVEPRSDLWTCCGVAIALPELMADAQNDDKKKKFKKEGLASIQWITGGLVGSGPKLERIGSIPDMMVHKFIDGPFMDAVEAVDFE